MRILDEILAVTKEKVERRRVGKTVSSKTKIGLGWAVIASLGQLKTGVGAKCFVKSYVVPQRPCKVAGLSRLD